MEGFNFVNIKSHIRTLAVQEPFLLSGVGSFLFVWIRKNSEFVFVRSIEILPEDVIGIRFEIGDRSQGHSIPLMIYSIRFILHCSITYDLEDESNFKLIRHHQINIVNMVMDLVCLPVQALILNSRNEVIFLDENHQIKQRVIGPEKCILYSGRFLDMKQDHVIVASGTVFKQVLIWILPVHTEHGQPVCLQTLHGHEGVIFDIEFHPQLNVLLSVSDDRSIRVWNASEKLQDATIETWNRNQFSLAHVFYGHEARIWKVRSTIFEKLPVCVSVGEDSNVIVWSLSEPFRMIQKRSLFRNNRIWSLELTDSEEIICGGSDGSIWVCPFQDMLESGSTSREKFELSSSLKALLYGKIRNEPITLASCLRGRFFTIQEQPEEKSFPPKMSQIFDDYIKMSRNHQFTRFALGSKHGHIAILDHSFDLLCLEKIFDQKILDISFVDEDRFLVCLLSGVMKLFRISGLKLEPLFGHDFILPSCRHQWSSCGMLSETGAVLVVGDYSGNISAYRTDSVHPFVKFYYVHGHNGVTCVRQKPGTSLVYSSGRNGKIMEFYIEENSNDFIKLRTYAFFSDMEWISGLEFDHQSCLRFAYGFESRRFMVWDLNRNLVRFEEDCGGGHRSWDVILDEENVHFSYSHKNDLIRLRRPWSSDYQLLDYSSLPRKINCCTNLIESNEISYLMVGGEDTSIQVLKYNNHKFSLERTLYGHISSVSSIKCLRFFKAETVYAISVGGRSQLIVWKFWFDNHQQIICQEKCCNFLGLFNEQMEFEENIRKTNDLVKLDVRYMDVDLIRSPTNTSDDVIELIILVACSDSAFRILQYTESDITPKIFTLKKIDCQQNSCILRCRILMPSVDSLKRIFSLANNCGTVNFWCWNFGDSIDGRLALSIKLHQSGINAIDFQNGNPEHFWMATGGDDNTLVLTLIRIAVDSNGQVKLEFLKKIQNFSIHTCQITDVRFWWENGRPVLTSVSIDQQLVRWTITDVVVDAAAAVTDHANPYGDGGQLQPKLANEPLALMIDRLSIADISSMCPVFDVDDRLLPQTKRIWMICGEGFQFVQENRRIR